VVHTFRGNVFAYNDVALGLMPSVRNNQFTGNSFFDNVEQVAVFGGGDLRGNGFTVDGVGNYWSDYRGYDADGNGVGDVTHKSQSLFENLMDREPRLRLFLFSPAQQAVELASRAFPVVKPRLRATDTAPLMRPVAAGAWVSGGGPAAHGGWSAGGLCAAVALLGVGGCVVSLAKRELR
jgi:nitrous oxidase accessory protein